MSFDFETTDMDLGNTPIENIFLNDYMPMANGTYVKVYLLGYKYAHDKDLKIDVTNKTIANNLDVPLEDVLRAWDFWERKGIIKKNGDDLVDYKVTFLNLKQLYIRNNIMVPLEKNEKKKSRPNLIEANKVKEINEMFNAVDYIMRRQTTNVEKETIITWIEDYNMNPDVIERAFNYSVEVKGKRSVKYVEGIIKNWYDQGLTNLEAVMETFKHSDEKYYRYQRVMKSIGLTHKGVTDGDMALINKWFDQYDYSMELVLKACEAASNVQYPTIKYIDGVINNWYKKGIKEVDDIERLDKIEDKKPERNTYSGKKKNVSYKTRFHNFEQRTSKYTPDQLEDIARKKREAHKRKVNGDTDE